MAVLKRRHLSLHAYLVSNANTHLKICFGASPGGVVFFELLQFHNLRFDRLFFEGESFYTKAEVLETILCMVFIKKLKKAVSDPEYSRMKMEGMFGHEAAPLLVRSFIHLNVESIRNIVHDCTHVLLLH